MSSKKYFFPKGNEKRVHDLFKTFTPVIEKVLDEFDHEFLKILKKGERKYEPGQ